IQEGSLTDYYLYLAQRRLDAVSRAKELLDYMFCFEGCEVMEVAHDLAFVTADALDRLGEAEAFGTVIEYLRILTNHHSVPLREGPWKRFFYREWFLWEYCSRLTLLKGPAKAFEFLYENSWYEPGSLSIRRPLPREMEQEANIALGYRYRTTWDV